MKDIEKCGIGLLMRLKDKKSECCISSLKDFYCSANNLNLRHNCFCCEYSNIDCHGCEKCPLDWVKTKYCSDDETSLYGAILCTKQWQEQADLARLIANLPERKM